jgi:hypothetical protein
MAMSEGNGPGLPMTDRLRYLTTVVGPASRFEQKHDMCLQDEAIALDCVNVHSPAKITRAFQLRDQLEFYEPNVTLISGSGTQQTFKNKRLRSVKHYEI